MSANGSDRPQGGLVDRLGYSGTGSQTGYGGGEIPLAAGASLGARVAAFIIDWVILAILYGAGMAAAAILGVLTLGLLWAPLAALLPLLPLAYHTLFLSSPRHATPGQAFMGIRAVSVTAGGGPNWLQAGIAVLLFYAGLLLTSGLILIWALFDARGRCLHDILSGTRIVRNECASGIDR